MDPKTESSAEPRRPRMCCQQPRPRPIRPSPGDMNVLSAIAITDHRWVNRSELCYCFVDAKGNYLSHPDSYLQTQMKVVRLAWQNWQDTGISLTFKEVIVPKDAIIRIAFIPGMGSFSAVGIYNESEIEKAKPFTMNFGWDLAKEPCTAEHEIGHALGFQHEHQNPNAGIVWNKEQIINDYTYNEGWTIEQIQQNILSRVRGPPEKQQATMWDRDSIMHYPFDQGQIREPVEYATKELRPAPYTICKYDAATNTLTSGLSVHDKAIVLKLYPPVAPVSSELKEEQPIQFNLTGPAENKHQVDFKFRPSESGRWAFTLQGSDKGANTVKSTVMIRNNKSDYVLDDKYVFADEDSDSRLVLPVKARPSLSANDEYVVTALFENTDIKGPFVMKATREPLDIVNYLGGLIGQNIRTGITVVNKTSSDIMVSITKEIMTDSGGWTTIMSGHQDRWGRGAGEYTIDLIVEGKQHTLEIGKGGVETTVFVKSSDDISLVGAL